MFVSVGDETMTSTTTLCTARGLSPSLSPSLSVSKQTSLLLSSIGSLDRYRTAAIHRRELYLLYSNSLVAAGRQETSISSRGSLALLLEASTSISFYNVGSFSCMAGRSGTAGCFVLSSLFFFCYCLLRRVLFFFARVHTTSRYICMVPIVPQKPFLTSAVQAIDNHLLAAINGPQPPNRKHILTYMKAISFVNDEGGEC